MKWIRSLERKKVRDELGLFIVEGEKMVNEAIDMYPDFIELLIHTEPFQLANNIPFESIQVSERELAALSSLTKVNKALVVMKKIIFKHHQNDLILALDSIQDPGNMGTILRTADWFGITKIISSNETVDIYNSKVVQASMGSIFRVEVEYTDLESFLSKVNLPVYGTILEGQNVYSEKLINKAVLLMGNEGKGIDSQLKKHITHPISIPKFGAGESLNVGVATGIFLSEFKRNH